MDVAGRKRYHYRHHPETITQKTTMQLTKEDALRAYARMMNTLDASHLEPFLADDFHYASQMVFEEITSRDDFLAYITPKLRTIADAGAIAYAEMAWDDSRGAARAEPCVVMAQNDKDNLVATVLAEVGDGKIRRLDMCIIPPPTQMRRTGEYP